MIDKHSPPYARAGMDLNARPEARDLRKKTRRKPQVSAPQPMVNMMRPQRVQARIAEKHHRPRGRGRVALEYTANIFADRVEQVHEEMVAVGVCSASWRSSSKSAVER